MTGIARVTIRAVRGIRAELPLKLDGKSLVVRGDNGTGKSSVVAALAWALLGEGAPAASPDGNSEAGLRRHLLETAPDAPRVVVELTPKGRIQVTPNQVLCDEDGRRFRDACMRARPFLRRPDLLQFVSSKPSDRFRYLETFLGLDVADELREGLQQQAKESERRSEPLERDLAIALAAAVAWLPAGTRVPHDTRELLAAYVERGRTLGLPPTQPTWEALLAATRQVAPAEHVDRLAARRAALDAALERLDGLSVPLPLDEALDETRRHEQKLIDEGLATLLGQAVRYLDRVKDERACPVCERDIDRTVLLDRLRARAADLTELEAARRRLAERGDAWRDYLHKLHALRQELEAKFALPPLENRLRAQEHPDGRVTAEELARMHGADLHARAVAEHAALRHSIAELRAIIPTSDLAQARFEFARAIEAMARQHQTIEALEAKLASHRRVIKRIKAAVDALRRARQEVGQELLTEIGDKVCTFYTAMHPDDQDDEVTGPPSIEVQGHGNGTAFVRGSFRQQRVDDPRWVYSDGHLDSVGICVFLALRRFRADRDGRSDPRLMVLDDIVLSIDLGHARRLLTVLRTFFDDHQVIILTHNGLFTDWCTRFLPKYDRAQIVRWSLEQGPQLGEYRSSRERLAATLDVEASPKLLAQAVMNLLDEWIAEARFAYALRVPSRRGDDYTLAELWDPFARTIRDAAKELAMEQPTTTLDRLCDVVMLRNRLGAHENEFAKEYPLAVVRAIGRDVLALVTQLHCLSCGTFATPRGDRKDPEVCRCDCRAIRYDRPRHAGD